MQKKNSTKQVRPRRAHMPQCVYDVTSTLDSRLRDLEALYPKAEVFKGCHTDETLCQEIVQPLRDISALAFHKELDPKINLHPHNDARQCRELVREAMRLAYGIQDLINAGQRVNKYDRALCAQLFEEFEKIKAAADAADERHQAARRGKKTSPPQEREGCQTYTAGLDWPLFDVHYDDQIIVKENGQAKVGQLVLVTPDNGNYEESFFARCCLVTDATVRVCRKDDKESYDKPISTLIGAAVEIKHDNCNHTRIEALRAKIAELQTSDDPISHTSKCYELEKQIFALEHPPEESDEDEVSDEWPDELDG